MAAKLSCEFRLASVTTDSFLGVSPGSSKSEIIVSHTNSVVVYEVKNQRPTSSWNVSSGGMSLKVAAVYDFRNDGFVSGLNNDTLRKWAPTVDRVTQGKKIKLSSTLLAVWSDRVFSDVLLVYRNGNIDRLEGLQRLFSADLDQSVDVQFLRIVRDEKGVHVIYITDRGHELVCHRIFIEKSTLTATYSSLALPSNGSNVLPMDICLISHSESKSSIYILWSDGVLKKCTVDDAGIGDEWNDVFCIEAAVGNGSVSLQAFGDQLLIGVANETPSVKCMLYSGQFGTLTSSITVDRDEPVRKLQLHAVGDRYLLQLDSDLFLMTVSHQSTKLSSIIGVKSVDATKCDSKKQLQWTNNGLEPVNRSISNRIKKGCGRMFRKKVDKLETVGVCDLTICESLLAEFHQKEDFDHISEVLTYYKHIPDSMLTDVLQSFLRVKVNYEDIVKTEDGHFHEVESERYPFIDKILSVPIQATHLRSHLKKLSAEQALFLVWYLSCLMEHPEFMDDSKDPSAENILDWMNMLLDAHFNNFLAKSDSPWVSDFLRALSNLAFEVYKYMFECVEIGDLISLLMTQRFEQDSAPSTCEYCIETLIFK